MIYTKNSLKIDFLSQPPGRVFIEEAIYRNILSRVDIILVRYI